MSPPDISRQSEKPRQFPLPGFRFCIKVSGPTCRACAMKSRRLQKVWKGNLGFSEATLSRFWLSLRVGFRISRYFEL